MRTSTTRPAGVTRPHLPLAAAAAATALALLLTFVGGFVETPWKPAGPGGWGLSDITTGELLAYAGFVLLGVAVVFGVVVRTGLRKAPSVTGRWAVATAAAAALLVVPLFWTGLPEILAIAALVLARAARHGAGRTAPVTVVAGLLAVLALAVAVLAAVSF
jgi:hypothetical protein